LKFGIACSYLVVYDPATSLVAVVATLHGARDHERLLENI
jgi:hypothetical protein